MQVKMQSVLMEGVECNQNHGFSLPKLNFDVGVCN